MNVDKLELETSPNLAMPGSLRPSRHLSSPREPHYVDDFDTAYDDYAPNHLINESEEDYVTEDDLPDPAPSGRSSISSFPASIIHHNVTPSQTFSRNGAYTPPRSRVGTQASYFSKPLSPLSNREFISGFRNPSSVRALQMRDELSDEDLTPGHKRRGSRISHTGYRSNSTHSTPGKRTSRSLQGSPTKNSRLRKEFPLVLLHCTILPSIISPKAKSVNDELLEAIIPEPYKKRWRLLEEKVLRNFEVRERGVLIPHPGDDYDNLEERLLESLELEQPVISSGHYVGRSESRVSVADSGFGSEENSSRNGATEEEEDFRCTDCGGTLCGEKRWEVKVYAANGLLKAGAWSAAWSEMEKVDVQVSVWLPEGVRLEVESRLDAVIAQEQQLQAEELQGKEETKGDARTREIYGETTASKGQEEIDGLVDELQQPQEPLAPNRLELVRQSSHSTAPSTSEQVDLHNALVNYVRLVLQDQRNIAIVLLCLLLGFYGMNRQPDSVINTTAVKPLAEVVRETKIEYLTTTIVSTSTSIALETSTIIETAHVFSPPEATTSATETQEVTTTNPSNLPASSVVPDVMVSGVDSEASNLSLQPAQAQPSIEPPKVPLSVTNIREASAPLETTSTVYHILMGQMEELGMCKKQENESRTQIGAE